MEHLSLEIFDIGASVTSSKFATLPEDAVITITDSSEIFAGGDTWSYSFSLNVRANAHIFGTTGELHGSRLHEQINKRRARLWVEGLPLYLGYLKLDDEADVDGDGNVDVRFESGMKTFDEMIEGAKANQVPMIGDVRFGVALWRKRWTAVGMKLTANITLTDGTTTYWSSPLKHDVVSPDPSDEDEEVTPFSAYGENTPVQEYPQMVFPKGEFISETQGLSGSINCLNTDQPYDENADGTPIHPYCNVALCYQKYGYKKKQDDGSEIDDYSAEPEAQRGYEYMPADRVNSAPNFFVIYWIRALMKHLGIYVEENQMMEFEDLRRLFFVNTKCAYRMPKNIRTPGFDAGYGRYRFRDGDRLVPEQFGPVSKDYRDVRSNENIRKLVKTDRDNCSLKCTGYTVDYVSVVTDSEMPVSAIPAIKDVSITATDVAGMSDSVKETYESTNGWLHDAFASSKCFPDVDVSEVIGALSSGFGIRFLFDDNYQRVRIVLLRNIFRSEEIQEVACDIIGSAKTENCIRGFRMTYGDSEDTHFYYKGFADMLPHKKPLWPPEPDEHDYSKWDLDARYKELLDKVSAFNKTCYVTPDTGNAYGVKVDQDAKRYEDLHPSLFEYAGFMDAEDGDCTGDEETIEEIKVGFRPAIMNDLNMEAERGGEEKQRFALFVDEQMRPRRPDLEDGKDYNKSGVMYDVDGGLYAKYNTFTPFVGEEFVYKNMMSGDGVIAPGAFTITSDMQVGKSGLSGKARAKIAYDKEWIKVEWGLSSISLSGHINEGYRLYLQDNYTPNDDGIAPIETHDWGLTLGIMRGSGSDMQVVYASDPDDGEGNDTWEIEPGSSVSAHPDTCNSYGDLWDYDGQRIIDTAADAASCLPVLFPDSNAAFNDVSAGYIDIAVIMRIRDNENKEHKVMFLQRRSNPPYDVIQHNDFMDYLATLQDHSMADVKRMDAAGRNLVIDIDSSSGRLSTLLRLCELAYGGATDSIAVDENGVGALYGRFSLKLRAEKPNPYYEEGSDDPAKKDRYLEIGNENLRGRGLADQFYKEYSYWVRNARIAKRTVRMELAQLLTIDKTKRVRVGDIIGFIRKMQYSVSNKTGLGEVTMEIMYI